MSDNKEQGKIYRRDTLLKDTKPKKKDAKNRKKSACVKAIRQLSGNKAE